MTAEPGSPGERIYLLFDIDGTLMEAEGAGRAALERAYDEATGVPGAMDGIVFAGRPDQLDHLRGRAHERREHRP